MVKKFLAFPKTQVNILFNPSVIQKKDVWQINLIEILKLLIKILEADGQKKFEGCRYGCTFFIPDLSNESGKYFCPTKGCNGEKAVN